jgi:hypothetical protein
MMFRSTRRNGTAGKGNGSLQEKLTKKERRKRRNGRKRKRLDRTDKSGKGET